MSTMSLIFAAGFALGALSVLSAVCLAAAGELGDDPFPDEPGSQPRVHVQD